MHRFEFALVWLVYRFFRLLGLENASRLSGFIWRMVAPWTSRNQRAQAHLRMAFPAITDSEIRTITRKMWSNLGRVMGETFFLDVLAREPHRLTFSPGTEEKIKEWRANGCVVVSLHLGNWEMNGICAERLGLNIAALYQQLSNPLVDRFLWSIRQKTYAAGLTSKGHDTVRRMLAHAKSGGCVGLLADFRDVRGVAVPFFGHMAYATPFPAMVARAYDLPLLVFRMWRTEGVNFKAEMVEVDVPRTEDRKADIVAATANVHAFYEDWIKLTPDQWMWAHRKWSKPGDKK